MKSVIVGTAGHIDHGKTSLVKALTGIDADRLEEEKRRGITIDLGFAHFELPAPDGSKIRIGFVDVPGHERFVRNMLAGVGGIDLVLLVIAADEGIKPQTREHFDICRLLGVERGMTVLTKSDAVDPETLEIVRIEVADFLRGSFLDGAPIVAASSLTGEGLAVVKSALSKLATEAPARDSSALARLPIDRVFSMKGFGTVVTGTLISGTIRKEEELEVFPARRRVRVRGVQVHGSPADQAIAGQRTALNLVGASTEDLARGMTFARPAIFSPTSRLDASISLLASAKPLKDGARVHFHAYTMETIAMVRLYGTKLLRPGENSFARLRLAEPALLLPRDRFILRQFSPVVTIGGGVVLDNSPIPDLKQVTVDRLLKVTAAGDAESMLTVRVARTWYKGLSSAQAVAETGWSKEKIESNLAKPIAEHTVLKFGDLYLYSSAVSALEILVSQSLECFHKENPLVPGMGKETLREKYTLSAEVFNAVLNSMAREKKLAVAGELVHLPGRGVVMKDEESESKKIIEQAFSSAGLKAPSLKEVLAGLKVDKVRAQKIVTLLLRDKILVKISEELVFHQSALADLRQKVAALKTSTPKIDVACFKDMTGVSRKYAIPLLEYLDRERVTRRVGDERIIL